MFIAFGLETVGILALSAFGHSAASFVLLTGFVFFAWGEIYSLFPSTCGDTFGAKFAIYTAKGTASLLVPLSGYVVDATDGWGQVFLILPG